MKVEETLRRAIGNWLDAGGYKITRCPPQAKVLTGHSRCDAQWHALEIESGLEFTLKKNFMGIEEWKIVNERKFVQFMLRYA